MKKISLLSLILSAGCMDWITVIPDDFVVAEAGPASADIGSRCGLDEDGDSFVNCRDDGTAVDCDDNDPDIYPGAEEVCGDGRDNNCNGSRDEECQAPQDAGPAPQDSGSTAGDSGQVTPGQPGAYQRNAPCYEGAYSDKMTLCMRFNGNAINQGSSQVEPVGDQVANTDNRAFDLTHERYISVEPESADLYTSAFTLAAWVKPNDVAADSVFTIFSSEFTDGEGLPQGPFRLEIVSGKPQVEWTNDQGNRQTLQAFQGSTTKVPTDRYTHIMVVFGVELTDFEMRLYVNGELSAVAGQTDPLSARNMLLTPRDGIGAHLNYSAPEPPFAHESQGGLIDDLRLWNKAQPGPFLPLEAGRWVDRSVSGLVEGWGDCAIAVMSGYEISSPCTKTYLSRAQRVESVRLKVKAPNGPPMGEQPPDVGFDLGAEGITAAVKIRYDRDYQVFTVQGTADPMNVGGCDFSEEGESTELLITFDWPNGVLVSCGDLGDADVGIPVGLSGGIDQLTVRAESENSLLVEEIEWVLQSDE